jgi:predicted transcriptional regulator
VTVEKLKLNLIQRVMKIEKTSTLERIEDILIQEEMEARLKESLEDIEEGRVHTLEEFKQMNEKWWKERDMKCP